MRFIGIAALTVLTAACAGAPYQNGASLAGTYAGTYGGNDNGSLVLDVHETGSVNLTAQSAFWHTTFTGNGTVGDDAHVSGTGAGGLVSITFVGTVGHGIASGSWTASNGSTGTWSTTRN
jgi:hypothetical protein